MGECGPKSSGPGIPFIVDRCSAGMPNIGQSVRLHIGNKSTRLKQMQEIVGGSLRAVLNALISLTTEANEKDAAVPFRGRETTDRSQAFALIQSGVTSFAFSAEVLFSLARITQSLTNLC